MAAAVASAANGDQDNTLDSLKPPSGVVLPPKEIRNILEKTAGYVARNGAVFEDRIRDKEQGNPKFSFLHPTDAYHEFYTWRLTEIRAGRGTDVAAGRAGEAAPAPEKPKGPPKPDDFQFSARMPRINQKDLDVIRLTALFVAKNGRQWMTQLAQRETGNPQFQFLIPNHTLHNFFQHIIDQYTMLLRAGGLGGEGGKLQEERIEELNKNISDKFHVLARAKQRAEYIKFQEEERKKKEAEAEEAQAEFARIDWGDFVVVETITFTESDETANLPPPTNLSELQYASLEDRNKASISASLRIEEAMPGEELSQGSFVPQQPAPSYPLPVHPGAGPQQPPNYVPAYPQAQVYGAVQPPYGADPYAEQARLAQQQQQAETARVEPAAAPARPGAPGGMKIRENYVPRAAQKVQTKAMTVCRNCNQQIPVDEIEEHMRIELLDPRWKEQKSRADARYASTTVSTADVANNLKRLASQRRDLFDPVTGQELTEEELARRKKLSLNSFGGNPNSTPQAQMNHMQNINVEEQVRAIHEKFADKK
ncbi:hypothetical protein VHEMI07164 [[Torrubiella] hemipterigena]|uniref:SURP motif domain-containing protein n=1 Tax=[Torrubiella] hemipterigena TaxID=1531966 RepID=A0A0A1T9H4_9HYPO|nr:hypothetical protein VHEMI07164 [[Torrubiella] hemipterigena]